MGRLIRVFNAAAPEIQGRIDRLEQDRQQLRVVLGAMAEAVIAVDARRRLLFANTSADALFGLDASSVGRLVPELIRSPQVQQAVEETLQLSHPDAYQEEVLLPGRESSIRGPARILSVRGTPLPGQPPSGAVLVFHDVTDLRRLERMRQDFVANASHELKTPLASIKAYTETLLDWALTDESVNRRFLERIDEQVDRLNQLILDMLSLARLESSQEFFEHGPLGLVPVLESCFEGNRGRAEAKNLSLTLRPRQAGRRNARSGRRRSRPADLRQPDRQRHQVHARREAACAWPARSIPTRSPSRWPTPASAFPATSCRESSSDSTGSTRRAAASWAEPGSACRSSST